MALFVLTYLGFYVWFAGSALYLSWLALRQHEVSRAAILAALINVGVLWPFALLVGMGLMGFAPVAQMDGSPPGMNLWSLWFDWFPTAVYWTGCSVLAALACLAGFLASPRRKDDWQQSEAALALVVLTVVHTLFAAHFVSMHAPDC